MELAAGIPQLVSYPKQGKHRSRVTNGSKLLPLSDGRSATARRFRDLYEGMCSDLGGADVLSEGQKQLARRAAMLSAECERLEALSTRGDGEFNLEQYGQMTDRLGRCLQRIGLERRSRDATPTLATIVARHRGEPP